MHVYAKICIQIYGSLSITRGKSTKIHCCVGPWITVTCVYNLRYHYVVTLQAELIQIKQPIVEIVANNTNYVMFISNSNMYYLMVSNLAAPMKSETAKSNALDFGDHTEKVNYHVYVYKKCNQTIYRIPRHLMIIVTLVI